LLEKYKDGHQAQIRLTKDQYEYLRKTKKEKHCSTSAYFRSLLVADMKSSIAPKEVCNK